MQGFFYEILSNYFLVPLMNRAYIIFIRCIMFTQLYSFPSRHQLYLHLISRAPFTLYLIVFSHFAFHSSLCCILLLYAPSLSFYTFSHKTSRLRTYSIINMYQRFAAHHPARPSLTLSHALFPLVTYFIYTFCIPSCVLRPYVYTNASRPFLSPHWKLIPRLRARSLCISKRMYALVASATIP